MNKKLKVFLIVLVSVIGVLLLTIVGILTAAGLMPGLSGLFGTNKTRDLGIKYNQQQLDSGKSKLDGFDTAPGSPGTGEVKETLTQEEFSALVDDNLEIEGQRIIEETQIKLNNDKTIEISGTLDVNNLKAMLNNNSGQISRDEQKALSDFLATFEGSQVPLYLKLEVDGTNGQMESTVVSAQAGRLSVPTSLLDGQVSDNIDDTINKIIEEITGTQLSELNISNGEIEFTK